MRFRGTETEDDCIQHTSTVQALEDRRGGHLNKWRVQGCIGGWGREPRGRSGGLVGAASVEHAGCHPAIKASGIQGGESSDNVS